ncbi:MAG TPA: 2-isopropylmalate synthase, partial [Chloroflexota bacterium]|nr:2-isopropylmalate synthase [Chloroflexota bacterium]
MADRVYIFDTTLRDGEQSPGASLTSDEKLEIARQLVWLGVDVIEAGFPIASPDDFEAVRRIARDLKGVVVCGLARAVPEDIDRCWEAVREAETPRIHTFISTSDIHLIHQFRKSREEALADIDAMVRRAKGYCMDVEFSPMDASRTDPEFVFKALGVAIAAGATTVNIPDTVGYSMPGEFADLIKGIIAKVPNIHDAIISVHCHNDLGLATANTLAAVSVGARQVECTINGIGERAGNASLEEVVMSLNTRKDLYGVDCRVNTSQIYKTSRMVSNYTGISVQPNKAIVGSNAFAHESGIHQDGVLKERSTYEIMDPGSVGIKSSLVMGKHSGRHALRVRLEELGYKLTGEDLNRAFVRFKEIADKKKEVSDRDLEAIVADEIQPVHEFFQLKLVQVSCGNSLVPTATVELIRPDGTQARAVALGTGPVDAAYKAIDTISKVPNRLLEYTVHAVTGGIDALGEVTIRIQEDGKTYVGHGADMDIVVASVKAYLTALNKVMANRPPMAVDGSDQSAAPTGKKATDTPNFGSTSPLGKGLWK